MKIHVVQKGDTLWEIAGKHGVDFEQVKQMNPQLSSPDMIMPGMKIKIPGSQKPVKKETSIAKEIQQPIATPPFKVESPKPLPVIKEDDHEKPKEIKLEMPIKPPEKPMMEMPEQHMPKMPIIEQEVQNFTTINVPKMPYYPMPEEKLQHKQVMPQPPKPQQHMPMMPMYCYMVHPCCLHGHYPVMGTMQPMPQMMHNPMYGNMMGKDMPSPQMEMPKKPAQPIGEKDCGCGNNSQYPAYPIEASFGGFPDIHGPQTGFHKPHMPAKNPLPNNEYPPNFQKAPASPYPAPPEFPAFPGYNFREDEDDKKSE